MKLVVATVSLYLIFAIANGDKTSDTFEALESTIDKIHSSFERCLRFSSTIKGKHEQLGKQYQKAIKDLSRLGCRGRICPEPETPEITKLQQKLNIYKQESDCSHTEVHFNIMKQYSDERLKLSDFMQQFKSSRNQKEKQKVLTNIKITVALLEKFVGDVQTLHQNYLTCLLNPELSDALKRRAGQLNNNEGTR